MNTWNKAIVALMCIVGASSILTAGCHDDHRGRHIQARRHRRSYTPARVMVKEAPRRRVVRAKRVERVRVERVRVEKPRRRPKAQAPRNDRRRPDARHGRKPNDKESFHVTVVNRTRRTLDLELEGKHEGDDDIGKVLPGGTLDYRLVVKSKKLPETFELEAGRHEAEFTLTQYSPRHILLVVTPRGIRQG